MNWSKLKWSRRNWMRLLGLTVVGVGVYLVATYGYLDRFNPTGWSSAQWAQLVVNLTGFAILYVAQRLWWNRQDEVWDEVDRLRAELDTLRESVHEEEEEQFEPEEAPDTINAIPSARPAPPPSNGSTAVFQAVRAEPLPGERPTVQRPLVEGGRTFSFKVDEETSQVG